MFSFIRRMGLVFTVVVALVSAANAWAQPTQELAASDQTIEAVQAHH